MPRYVIERNFGAISDDDMLAASVRSDQVAMERFPDIVWERSHVVANDEGEIVTYCIYGPRTRRCCASTRTRSART